jgi:gluconokinase
MVILLMGVAGSGKTTVGRALAAALGWSFRDADEFHPPANVAKMAAGQPLTDADRAPWLAAIRGHVDACLARSENAVVTCSALKAAYRTVLVADPVRVKLVHLTGDPGLIAERMAARRDHFMPSAMLASQLAALEPPRDALTVDIAGSPDQIVAQIRRALSL